MTRRGQIDDRQPPVGEGYAGLSIDPDAMVVRTTMGDGVGHLVRDAFFFPGSPPAANESRNSTHPLTVFGR